MSKALVYTFCALRLKERELYQAFKAVSSFDELEKKLAIEIKKQDLSLIKSTLNLMENKKIKVTSVLEEDYPLPLRNIDYSPPILFYIGEYLPSDYNAVAFVGSRDATLKGVQLVEYFLKDLKNYPITIISGLARGIDTAAHRLSLDYGLRTISVLGCGLDKVYPASNWDLFKRIAQRGVIFSEFPPGTPPLPHHFPRRNRIISGLSKAIVIIEAGKKSGSLITARFAFEQNKELFVVPRTPIDKNAWGNNMLIKNGAKILTQASDLVIDVFPEMEVVQKKIEFEENLTDDEKRILQCMSEEPINFDSLCFLLEKGPVTMANFLLQLELKGKVRSLPGKNYIKI